MFFFTLTTAGWLSEMIYFFTPVFALVVCNVVLFSVTAHRIRSIRQETAILKGAESARSDRLKKDKQRLANKFSQSRLSLKFKTTLTRLSKIYFSRPSTSLQR
jgi:hypothetical protein